MQVFGKYRGLVVSREDPKKLGRLLVRVPALFGAETIWADPCFPLAGPNLGAVWLPPPGSGVWVEFEAGDPSRPIWSGCWYAAPDGQQETPQEALAGYPRVTEWRTETGFAIYADENPGQEKVRLSDDVSGLELLLDRVAKVFRVLHPATQLRIELDATNRRITLSDGTRRVVIDQAASLVRLFDGANEVLMDGANIFARAAGGQAYRLLDERFLPVFNNHTHAFTDSRGDSGTTQPPGQRASAGAHTTTVLRGG